MKRPLDKEKDKIKQAISSAKSAKPAYSSLYPLLEALFLAQLEVKQNLALDPPSIAPERVQTRWSEGFPLLKRWEFPIDTDAAEKILTALEENIPADNLPLRDAGRALRDALTRLPQNREEIWKSFLEHEWEPWEEWVDTTEKDVASIIFCARSSLRPSLEVAAQDLTDRFPVPASWLKGYCPVCGSLPSLLSLQGEGERRAYCSWCATQWGLYRIQCPSCENRHHESLGYLYTENEPQYHVHYCRLCKTYFKQIDVREMIDPVYFPLEEWTTLHLDLLAQRAGWQQPASPSPIVYGEAQS
ncbi:formate dehydrogenase accessory protein FdhE [Desulfoferrobacter suflitae]|uniref:formate dehydrogenase accessory protein FdhE n=1 Tax=Desulfoferrobacter suflitae TaxID=2865782 RepID=UPI0021647579|nr:formate dehydrogenase accessory protein FdhE [Desulfoferrobacter suflitae]MCK8603959.1 formate dehydrogenase accessory protein FdhE [Desulfoferrobacter suflitae]